MITMKEALSFPELQMAVVHTGKSGLFRKIRWVHVMDTEDVGLFLDGGEFLLTCGQVWPQNKESEEKLLKSLRNKISGILFATGRYLTECPPSILEFGKKNSIPVIEVPYHVPFVKITQKIHQEIMDRDNNIIQRAVRVPPNLRNKLQSANSFLEICGILSEDLKCSIAITDKTNQIFVESSVIGVKRVNIKKCINDLILNRQNLIQMTENVKSFYSPTNTPPFTMAVQINVTGYKWGTLWFIGLNQELKEEIAHILEFTAALLIDLVLNIYEIEEENRQLRLDLLELLIENPETASIIVEEKTKTLGLEEGTHWLAGLLLLEGNKPDSSQLMEKTRDECKKWIEETEGINGFCEIYENQLVLLISTILDKYQVKPELNHLQINLRNTLPQTPSVLVWGGIKENVLSFIESYQEAIALAPLVLHQSQSGGTYFSDQLNREMFLYGGFSPKKAKEFRNLILPKEILAEKGSTLYTTLKCLSLNNYNREKVTKDLHIHMNTLRYRIKRIEELFEDSLTSLRCQFWIQAALDLESLAEESKD